MNHWNILPGCLLKPICILPGCWYLQVCALLMKPLKKRHQRIVLFTVFFITAFWSSSKDYIQGKSEGFVSVFKSGLPEIRFFRDSYESYVQIRKDNLRYAKVIETSDHWDPQVTETGYDTYILVIGESVRKDFMHAFGFELHPNTPWMSSRNGLFSITTFLRPAPPRCL